jgi:hypothetical protein
MAEQRQTTGKRLLNNASNAIPRYIIALDCETLPTPSLANGRKFSHKLRLAVAIVGRIKDDKVTCEQTYRLKTRKQIWDLIKNHSKANYTLWIVCHNTLFDMVVSGMPEEFENGSITIDSPRSVRKQSSLGVERKNERGIVCIESPPFIIGGRIGATQGRIVIIDTLNWFQCPLSDLGRACKLEKLPFPRFDESDETWFKYCERDTRITFNSFIGLIQWVKENDMGMFRYTGPAQAMAAYRHRFKKYDILLHDNMPIKTIERSAYFGGRFECFKMGELNETIHQLDVNALFPSVMACNKFPVTLDTFDLSTDFISVPNDFKPDGIIAECEILCNSAIYPVREERGVFYPIGRFKTTLCGPELSEAIRKGHVKAIRAIAKYRMELIFENWVTELWQMRRKYKLEGNLLYESFCKMLMNSLYGKFGQRANKWENVPERLDSLPWTTWVENDKATKERVIYRSFGLQSQRMLNRELRHHANMEVCDWNEHSKIFSDGEIDTSFIAISAFVTSYARQRMNYLRAVAGNANCYYQGVDSLIVNHAGLLNLNDANLVSESELGKLRLQLSANNGYVRGISDYTIGNKVVLSGLSQLTTQEEMRLGMQRTLTAKPYLFQGRAIDSVTEELIPWSRNTKYWKGNVSESGQVEPLELPLTDNLGAIPSS